MFFFSSFSSYLKLTQQLPPCFFSHVKTAIWSSDFLPSLSFFSSSSSFLPPLYGPPSSPSFTFSAPKEGESKRERENAFLRCQPAGTVCPLKIYISLSLLIMKFLGHFFLLNVKNVLLFVKKKYFTILCYEYFIKCSIFELIMSMRLTLRRFFRHIKTQKAKRCKECAKWCKECAK